jgi:hypothetical protein
MPGDVQYNSTVVTPPKMDSKISMFVQLDVCIMKCMDVIDDPSRMLTVHVKK